MALSEAATLQLAETHRPYAHALAAEVLKKLPPNIEKAELQAYAELGLIEAARAFDARPGVQFKTFAYYRIRGAIYDGIRKATWFSRKQYRAFQFESGANDYLGDLSESAQAGAPSLQSLEHHTGALLTCYMLSLENEPSTTPVDPAENPEQAVARKQQIARLREALPKLPEKNRRVLEAYYFEDKNLDEIGAEMGLSKSWTCRLHAKAIELLRVLLEAAPEATSQRAVR